MSDPINSGPSWARKEHARARGGTNWGLSILIILGCIAAPAIFFNFLHNGFQLTSFIGGFGGGPSRHQAAVVQHAIEVRLDGDAVDFQREMKAAGPGEFLMPRALAAPGGLNTATNALARQRVIVDKYAALYERRKAEHRREIGALYSTNYQREQALAKFDANNAQTAQDVASYWAQERDILSRENDMVDYLRRVRSGWRADGDRVLFTRPGLLPAYQADVNDLRERHAALSALVSRMNFDTIENRRQVHQQLGE